MIYVDDIAIPATVRNGSRTHTSRWSHLTADSEEELHAFAARLGLKRSYFQPGPDYAPHWRHYDVTEGKRRQAIRLGARAVAWDKLPGIADEPESRSAVRHDADRLKSQAIAAYRAADYSRALALIGECQTAAPARAAEWASAMRVITAAMPAAPDRPKAQVIRSGRHGETVQCGCGREFGRPHGADYDACLSCITASRLNAAGISAGDRGLAQLQAHNSLAGVRQQEQPTETEGAPRMTEAPPPAAADRAGITAGLIAEMAPPARLAPRPEHPRREPGGLTQPAAPIAAHGAPASPGFRPAGAA